MIEIRIDQLLADHGRTFYWLAKETGISHTTLWRLKKGKALGINFETLEKMCLALKCQPGDVFALPPGFAKKNGKRGNLGQRTGKRRR
jgi:putative transcriptional regulator